MYYFKYALCFIRGGILQTVIGENLDSIAVPQLIVYQKEISQSDKPRVLQPRVSNFTAKCIII